MAEDGSLTDYTRAGAAMRSALLQAADKGYLMADGSKFGLALSSRIPEEEEIAGLLVDREPPERIREALARKGVPILL